MDNNDLGRPGGPSSSDGASKQSPPLRASVPDARGDMAAFQGAVADWMLEVFGDEIAMDPLERIMRFLEEALELAHAEGMTADEVGRFVSYVFGRPVGETPQEVGGVMVTLAAFCYRRGISMKAEALREFDRIGTPEMRRKIFEKQAFKRSQGLTCDGGFRAAKATKARRVETLGSIRAGAVSSADLPKTDDKGG